MTNAVILSAGQGKRLSPLTDDKPKCLVEIAGRPVLEWQLRALAANGIEDVAVVTGYAADRVEAEAARWRAGLVPRFCYNPFYQLADNIASCWLARRLIGDDAVLINGDTLFEPTLLGRILAESKAPISVAVDAKARYDSDDMKVRVEGRRLTAIGKTLDGRVDGESIGLLRFTGRGGRLFGARVDRLLRDLDNLRRWYLSVIHDLAQEGHVEAVSIAGAAWCEIDFPRDLKAAEAMAGALAGRNRDDAAATG